MKRPNKYVDIIFLVLFGASLCFTLFLYFKEGYILSVNNLLALILFIGGIIFKIKDAKKGQYLVLALLLLATLNIINFTTGVGTLHIGKIDDNDSFNYSWPGVDPLFLLMFFIYWIINRKAIGDIWHRMSYGSDNEKEHRFNKEVEFYYNKFKDCDNTEFGRITAILSDYPKPAQEAISKIAAERAIYRLTNL